MRENLVMTWPCVRGCLPTVHHYTDADNRERARAKDKTKKERRRSSLRKKKTWKIQSCDEKMTILAASNVKMSCSEKKLERRNIYYFPSIKRTTRKFHVRWSRAKQWQKNVDFLHFSLPSPVSITRFLLIFFFLGYDFEYINESCAFSPG